MSSTQKEQPVLINYTQKEYEMYNGQIARNIPSNKDAESQHVSKDEVIPKMNKGKIICNLLILDVSYCIFFTGFWALTNLQSTMNAESGIGPASQATIYGFTTISSLFLPELSIYKFGCKKVIFATTVLCLPYIAANIYLRWDTLMLASVVFGLGYGPLQAASTVYIHEIALRYQKCVSQSIEFIMVCFYGSYAFFIENAQIWGNIISFYVLKPDSKLLESRNSTSDAKCGVDYLSDGNSTNMNLEPPEESDRFLLIYIYLGMGAVAIFLLLFLDSLQNDTMVENGCQAAAGNMRDSLRHMANPQQLLLIPLTVGLGVESALYSNEITEAYIACSWGMHHVGFVTVCFGVCASLMSVLLGPLAKCVPVLAVLIFSACVELFLCVVLFLWKPSPSHSYAYFIVAGAWGAIDAVWWAQLPAFYGLVFPDNREAAFSNFCVWNSLGFFVSYLYANWISITAKIIIVICFMVTGMIGCLMTHFMAKRAKR